MNPHPRRGQIYWVTIPAEPRQKKRPALKCEQITTLPKERLSDQALGGPLSGRLMDEVERGVIRSIGIPVD